MPENVSMRKTLRGVACPRICSRVPAVELAGLFLASLVAFSGSSGCRPAPLQLHVPQLPPSTARTPTIVDVEPLAAAPEENIVIHGRRSPSSTAPELVLTSGIRTELAARALRGGERGGYVARCRLDRF